MAKATTSKDSVDREFKGILQAVIADKPNADESLWKVFGARLQRIGQFKIDRLGYRGILNAEDVANEILHKFIRRVRLGKYGWVCSPQTFVAVAFLIADDVVRRAKNKEHQHLIHQTDPLCSADVIKSFANPFSPIHDIDVADSLLFLMNQLDPDERTIVELRLAGNRISQVAQQRGVSSSQIQRKLARIREKLSSL